MHARLTALALLLATPAAAQDRMSVVLDWFVNPDHGPIIVAQEQGYFSDAGLEVEVIAPADPADPPKMAAAGRADLAISYQPQLHLQVAEGMPLVVLYGGHLPEGIPVSAAGLMPPEPGDAAGLDLLQGVYARGQDARAGLIRRLAIVAAVALAAEPVVGGCP